MRRDPAGIFLAHRLDSADQDLVVVLHAFETYAAVEGQGLLRRVENLQEMTAQAGGGEARDHFLNVLERRQKITDQDELGVPRQCLECRQARCSLETGRAA